MWPAFREVTKNGYPISLHITPNAGYKNKPIGNVGLFLLTKNKYDFSKNHPQKKNISFISG